MMDEYKVLNVEIAKLELKPGQLLVVNVPLGASSAECDILKTKLERILSDGVHCLVLRGDVKFTVMDGV